MTDVVTTWLKNAARHLDSMGDTVSGLGDLDDYVFNGHGTANRLWALSHHLDEYRKAREKAAK